MNSKCPDCENIFEIPEDTEDGEVFSCPCCGLELEYHKDTGELSQLTIEGEDWGELEGLFKLKGEYNCYRNWKRKNTMLNIW